MKTKSKKKIIIAIIVVLIVLAAVIFFLSRAMKKSVESSSLMSEQTAVVEKGDINLKIFGRGVLRPANQYEIKSLVKGEVLTADFEEGDKVKKGDTLFAISQEEVEGQVVGAKIGLQKSRNSLDALKAQISDLKAVTSISGTITKLDIKKGDNVSNGQVVGEVADTNTLKLIVYFSIEDAKKIKSGASADVIVDSTGESLKGKVVNVDSKKEIIEGGINAAAVKINIKGNFSSLAGAVATAKISGMEAVKGGALETGETAAIVAKASGQVVSLNFEKGDTVKAGSVIAKLESKDLDRQIESAKLDIKQAETGLDDAKRRQKSYEVTAPIEGTLVKKNKKAGDIVDPTTDGNNGGLGLIYDLSSMKLTLSIDELDVLKIKEGQKVEIEAAAIPNKTFEAVVENVSMQGKADGGVTTYPVTIRLLDMGELLPGMNVTGNIYAADLKGVISVPSACLQRGNKLYVKDNSVSNNKDKNEGFSDAPAGYKEIEVEIGVNDGERIEIKSGVKEGDIVYMPPVTNEPDDMDMGFGMG